MARRSRRGLIAFLLTAVCAALLVMCVARRHQRATPIAPVAEHGADHEGRERKRRVDQRRAALDPTLPRFALAGIVVDRDGVPVAGADVLLAVPPARTRSDTDGRFRFTQLTAGPVVLEARHGETYAGPVNAQVAPVSDDVTLRLYPAGRVEVRCVDDRDDAPLAGARAGVRMHSMFPGAVDLEAITGADGVAPFAGMPAAGLEVWCAAEGYALGVRAVDSTQEGAWRVTVELERGAPIQGRVIDERGSPVADATIEIAAGHMPALAGVKGAVRSQGDGAFVVPGVAAGTWFVHADHPGHELGVTRVEVPAGRGPPAITVVVGDGVTVTGVVATRDLAPAPAATIEVRFLAGGRVFRTVQADGTGQFAARGLPRDQLQLVARLDRAASPPATIDTRAGEDIDDLLLALDDDAIISGVVVAHDGRPLADISVFVVHDTRDDARASAAAVEVTAADGRFELHGLVAGDTYVLTAMRPGHFAPVSLAMRSVGVRAQGGDDITIRMPADGAIRGRVVMSDGGALPADLRVRLGGTPQRVERDGRFQIEGVPPERHALRVDARGVPELVRGDVQVEAGEVTDVGELRLTRGRQVSGVVTDDRGTPVAGAEVRFVPIGIVGKLTADTDGRGRYRRALPMDRDCEVSATAGDLGTTATKVLRAGAADAHLDLRFGAVGRISGVVRADGRPAPGRFVLLGRREDGEPPAAMTTTDAAGAYELPVAGGTYRVSLVVLGEAGGERFIDRTVTVTAGQATRVDLEE